jgi:hypothetical protein
VVLAPLVRAVPPVRRRARRARQRREQRRLLHAHLRRHAKATGRDLWGWSYRQLYQGAATPGNPNCGNYDDLLTIIEAIRGGILTTPELHDERTFRGIILPKDDGTGRLIGIPPILARLAASFDVARLISSLTEFEKVQMFGSLQFAVANAAGAPGGAMTIQALIDGGQLEEPIVNTQTQTNDGDGDGEEAGGRACGVAGDFPFAA